ncbi:MAG: PilZ domain-containing protein [Acidobacteriia bacterium]|nr:PilZ domain-containing protein [Terriglobia bacterium]
MGKITQISQPPHSPERKYRRFALRYPVEVKFAMGNSVSELQTLSRNLSVGGLLLEATAPIPTHAPVSFTITVNEREAVRPIQLVGEGKVVRVEQQASGPGFAIAVECNRPLAEMRDYLAAAGY